MRHPPVQRLQGDVGSLQEFLESSIFAIGDLALLVGIIVVLVALDLECLQAIASDERRDHCPAKPCDGQLVLYLRLDVQGDLVAPVAVEGADVLDLQVAAVSS